MCLHVWKPDDRLSLRITGLSLVCSKHRPRTPPRQVLQVGQRCTYGFSHTPYEGEYLALISSEHLANVSVCVCVQHSYLLSKLEFSRKKHCESFAAFQRPGSVLLSYCEWHTCNVIAVFSLSPDSCVRLKFTGHFSFCCRSHSPHQHIHHSASEEKRRFTWICSILQSRLCYWFWFAISEIMNCCSFEVYTYYFIPY